MQEFNLPTWENSPETPIMAEDLNAYTEAIKELLNRDYILDQGTEGIWIYRKRNNGFVELWATYSDTAPSEGYVAGDYISVINNHPFPIYNKKVLITNHTNAWRLESPYDNTSDGDATTLTKIVTWLKEDAPGESLHTWNVYIVGYWKEME